MKKIAVLIACHNRKALTMRCLDKLYSQGLDNAYALDVFLVDDRSTDGTGQAVLERYPQVHLIKGSGALYWNRGMSLAWRTAGYSGHDYYLWLNDDVELLERALPRLLHVYETSTLKKPFILLGSTYDPVTGQVSYGGARRSDSPLKKLRFSNIIPGADLVPADTMNGNIALVPEAISQKLAGLDPRFSHAMGDIDFGLRAIQSGFGIQVAPFYYGKCSGNSIVNSHLDKTLSTRERWKKLASRKGLPMRDWQILCRRHAGIFWLAYFLWPYLKFLTRR